MVGFIPLLLFAVVAVAVAIAVVVVVAAIAVVVVDAAAAAVIVDAFTAIIPPLLFVVAVAVAESVTSYDN